MKIPTADIKEPYYVDQYLGFYEIKCRAIRGILAFTYRTGLNEDEARKLCKTLNEQHGKEEA